MGILEMKTVITGVKSERIVSRLLIAEENISEHEKSIEISQT